MNPDKYIKELRDEEKRLTEGLITQPSPTLEAYQQVVGRIQGIRFSIDTFTQQFADE